MALSNEVVHELASSQQCLDHVLVALENELSFLTEGGLFSEPTPRLHQGTPVCGSAVLMAGRVQLVVSLTGPNPGGDPRIYTGWELWMTIGDEIGFHRARGIARIFGKRTIEKPFPHDEATRALRDHIEIFVEAAQTPGLVAALGQADWESQQ